MSLIVNNLTKSFNDQNQKITIFDNCSFTIESGKSVSILGSSGSGKTTLLYLLAGLENIDHGEISFNNYQISTDKLSRKSLDQFRLNNLGFVYQSYNLLPEFTALENVQIPMMARGESKENCQKAAKNLLDRVGLAHRSNHLPSMLSGGEQQRVAIARALVNNPKLILADEPTGNLDFDRANQIGDLLFELQKENGSTLIIATHSHELSKKTDICLVLENKKLNIK